MYHLALTRQRTYWDLGEDKDYYVILNCQCPNLIKYIYDSLAYYKLQICTYNKLIFDHTVSL